MWKATVGAQINVKPEIPEDDDWETDPDFVNDVTEEQQRWGSTTGRTAGAIDMEKLRRETEEADRKKKQQELLDGPNASYGYGGKFGVQKDRMDQSAMGHDYVAKVEKHMSQKDYSAGFGGKYGVQTDRVDKSAVSWAHKEKIEKHTSQKDYTTGFGGKFGVQKDRQDKSAVGWDHLEKVEKHESQKDYSQGFGGKFGVQKDRQDKSALGWEYHEAPQKHESQTDHKIGFGGKFGVQTDRMDKSALTFEEESTKIGTTYSKVKPDIGGAKPSDLRAKFEKMAFEDDKSSTSSNSAPPRGNVHSRAAIFTTQKEEKPVPEKTQEKITKLDQSKLTFLTPSNEPETTVIEKTTSIQVEKSKTEYSAPPEIVKEVKKELVEKKLELDQTEVQSTIQQEVKEVPKTEVVEDKKTNIETPETSPTEDYSQEEEIVDTGLSAVALYDYLASADDEISFDPGDLITHIEMIDQGWWRGMCKGSYGLFPANYVQLQA